MNGGDHAVHVGGQLLLRLDRQRGERCACSAEIAVALFIGQIGALKFADGGHIAQIIAANRHRHQLRVGIQRINLRRDWLSAQNMRGGRAAA
jgi:hypothetical protein